MSEHTQHQQMAMSQKKEKHADHQQQGMDHSGHEQMFRTRFWWSLLLTIPVLLFSPTLQDWFGFNAPSFPGSRWLPAIFSIAIFGYGGVPFLQMMLPEIRKRQPGMMTLISLAISVSFVYSLLAQIANLGNGFFWELVTLIDIMLLGHWLEMRSVRQASGALDELAKLMPYEAERIKEDGSTETIQTASLRTGDLILVRPGANIPADGKVTDGESSVNESMITGESRPIKKSTGNEVIAGTVNGDGSLRVKVTATGDETAFAGIMRLVKQAQQSKSQTQLLADKAAGWLFYIALGSALVTAVAWVLAIGFQVEVLKRVVTVLVIACPHALGLAVPLVVAITTPLGARNGILVRDRAALEAARKVDVVIFDKTGTLTKGEFGVVDIKAVNGRDENEALALAAAIEGESEHLIARAIRKKAKERELSLPGIEEFKIMKGRGVQAKHEAKTVYLGGPALLMELNISLTEEMETFTRSKSEKAQSSIYLVEGRNVIAAFAITDEIRAESKQAVQVLHEMNIEVVMLTGDSQATAKAIGEELGIDQVFFEMLPDGKIQQIVELQVQGKLVAMVGDGINDAPALTKADIGIAIGGGTDVAIESAGLILIKDNPLDVGKVIALSNASHKKMIQNLWWAAGYNILALPLAAGALAFWGILLSPALGALLMSLSTVIVAVNAQLLNNEKNLSPG